MKLNDLKRGEEYWHRTHGRVLFIACQPHDGAYLICQAQKTTDPDDDDHMFIACESSDLAEVELKDQWPYLGFTIKGEDQ